MLSRTTGHRATVILAAPSQGARRPAGEVACWDLNVRHLSAARAEAVTLSALAAIPAESPVIMKVDSLLRGNIAAQLRALHAARPAQLIMVATTLPAAQRTVIAGRPTLAGGDDRSLPESILGIVGELAARIVLLHRVRGDQRQLHEDLAAIAASGEIALCDAETEVDLARLAAAGWALGASFVGSAGLLEQLGPMLIMPAPRRALVVVGTAEPIADSQLNLLAADGIQIVAIDSAGAADTIQAALIRDGAAAIRTTASCRSVKAIAKVVRSVDEAVGPLDLILTGGHTARRVLDGLGHESLTLLGEVHHGAVLSQTADGRRIVTRPGSFGGPDSLRQILSALHDFEGHDQP